MCRITEICCFRCLEWFTKESGEECNVCGDWKCVKCGCCLCALTPSEKRVAVAYMMGYEKFLAKVTGVEYDMKRHEKVLKEIGVPV